MFACLSHILKIQILEIVTFDIYWVFYFICKISILLDNTTQNSKFHSLLKGVYCLCYSFVELSTCQRYNLRFPKVLHFRPITAPQTRPLLVPTSYPGGLRREAIHNRKVTKLWTLSVLLSGPLALLALEHPSSPCQWLRMSAKSDITFMWFEPFSEV